MPDGCRKGKLLRFHEELSRVDDKYFSSRRLIVSSRDLIVILRRMILRSRLTREITSSLIRLSQGCIQLATLSDLPAEI
jgi:hypothetical protein